MNKHTQAKVNHHINALDGFVQASGETRTMFYNILRTTLLDALDDSVYLCRVPGCNRTYRVTLDTAIIPDTCDRHTEME